MEKRVRRSHALFMWAQISEKKFLLDKDNG